MRRILIMCGTLGVAFATFVATAVAQAPGGYVGEGSGVEDEVAQQGGGNALGSLPFTGLDLALLVGAALVLVAVGISLRRVGVRRS